MQASEMQKILENVLHNTIPGTGDTGRAQWTPQAERVSVYPVSASKSQGGKSRLEKVREATD